ncbi:RNA polymerase subunit sigma-24 [Actinophytocola xinjiangensis]|uniref:RNA polymerase subunit sigma-24 n=1 Tax=Actinophytocola xinjiangensis TaxID=485602 RepID=A0A7Z0WS17_9PSEU|nr:DUF6596 domain-containing protein [Actinophytocola xinjiangensis]OLF11698.1 RNA polymerase subunit sigma-24 [Actinophytocola xinjiangensis]
MTAAAAVSAAFRTEWSRIVATLIAWSGDWDLAEEAAQEAFAQALRTWPRDGVPDRPGAWLTTTARRRAIDRLRRDRLPIPHVPPPPATPGPFADDRLRLIFTCCHPALPFPARVVLALRTLTGLTTAEIARAFDVPEPTMAKRLVRAKHRIREAAIPYRVPSPEDLPDRTDAVLAVLYLLYNEGYTATAADTLDRPDLRAEATYLAGLLADLLPADPEVVGLHALLLLHQSRAATRTDPDGTLVPLEDQDRTAWDHRLIATALTALRHTTSPRTVVSPGRDGPLGPYRLQAMIAACHCVAARARDTDWARVVTLYDALYAQVPSPAVALNRAVAVAMATTPGAGLALLDDLPPTPHHPAVRADLLRRLGRAAEAAGQYRQALTATANEGERRYLRRRLAEVAPNQVGR